MARFFSGVNVMVRILTVFSLLIIVTLPGLAEAVTEGESLFHQHCSGCHGVKAIGEDPKSPNGGWRDDGSRIAPALNGTAHAWHHEPELLYDYVRNGSVDPESPMPSFGDRLNDQQIRAVIGYFQSLWPEKVKAIYESRFPGALNRE